MENNRHVSSRQQISIYLRRCARIFKNEKGWKLYISTGLMTLLITLVAGSDFMVAKGATEKGAFAIVSACIWCGIFNSVRSVCRERDIVKREYRTGLRLHAYITAHWLFEARTCLVEAFIVSLLLWITNVGHYTEHGVLLPAFIEYFIACFLIIFSADALGILISSAVPNENAAMTVMPFALLIQLLLCGVVFELKGIAEALSYLTIGRWGQVALCTIADYNQLEIDAGGLMAYRVEKYTATVSNLTTALCIMLIYAVLYAVLSVLVLRLVDRDSR